MSLKNRVSTGLTATLFFSGALFADAVSITGGYVGSSLTPGPYYTSSPNSSYGYSKVINSQGETTLESLSENTTETLATSAIQTSTSLISNSRSGPGEAVSVVVDAFSGIFLTVTQPVYVSASVTLSHNYAININYPFSDFAAYSDTLQFYDASGNPVGTGCNINPHFFTAISVSSTENCSTGKVLMSGSSTIGLSNNFDVDNEIAVPGDSISFDGTTTLGELEVYDLSGNLIQTLDLNSPTTAVPEPNCIFATGLIACALAMKRRS